MDVTTTIITGLTTGGKQEVKSVLFSPYALQRVVEYNRIKELKAINSKSVH